MPVDPKDLDHVRRGTQRLICARRDRRGKKCYACGNPATVLCDHPKPLPEGLTPEDLEGNPELALELTTCSRPCCARHACYAGKGKQFCREHAEQEGVWA